MRVVDENERDQRVQDGFNRWRRRVWIGHGGLLHAHHVGVAQLLERRQLEQGVHSHRREAFGFDRGQIPTAALHVQKMLCLSEQIRLTHLDGGVAAAVQHQRGFTPEQPRAVHPECQGVDRTLSCFLLVPKALHRAAFLALLCANVSASRRLWPDRAAARITAWSRLALRGDATF
jgi:hypothetical protein